MTLRGRLIAAFSYVMVLLSVALVVPFALNIAQRIDNEVEAEAAGQVQLVAASASGQLADRSELARLVRRAARSLSGRVIVVDARGRLLSDSAGGALTTSSYASRPEIARALDGATAQGRRHSESLDEELLFTAVPVVSRGRPVGAVRATQSVEAVNDRKRRDVLVIGGLALAALLLGLAVAWLLADSLTKPLRSLAAVARRIADGDREARAEVTGSREQRDVAVAFNGMTDRLRRAVESQAEFVSNASHQLRTPLTGLRLRLEAAARKSNDPAVRRDLDAAEAETERLATLLANLLILAREESPESDLPEIALADVVREARERWEASAAGEGRELRVETAESVTVCARPDELAAILDNLLENALKYSPRGSEVGLRWSVRGDHAVIEVADSGPGIPESEREAVFERFYRGETAGEAAGTGLGLPIAAALARRSGAELRLRDREGGGTVAALGLRVAGREAERPAAAAGSER